MQLNHHRCKKKLGCDDVELKIERDIPIIYKLLLISFVVTEYWSKGRGERQKQTTFMGREEIWTHVNGRLEDDG